MKKTIKAFLAIAVSIVALVSCAKDASNQTDNERPIEVTLIAGTPDVQPTSRTQMDGSTPKWCDGDAIGVSNGTSTNSRFDENSIDDGVAATTASFSGSVASVGTYYAYYPYTTNGVNTKNGTTGALVDLPSDQHPSSASFDGTADILVSKSFAVSTTETTIDNLEFARLGAIVKVVLIDETSVMTSTQHPSSVSMTAASNLVGRVVVDMENQEVAAPYYNQSRTVTASYTDETHYAINGINGTYFVVYPQLLAEGSTLAIEAATEDYTIAKEITIPAGGIDLKPGKVTTLNISLTSSHIAAKADSDVYELYTSPITEGDYLIVSDGSAMKASIASNRFEMTAVTITDNKIYDPVESLIWHIASNGGYWTIYNEDAANYAAGNNKNSQGALITSVTDFAKWSFGYESEWTITNKGNADNSMSSVLRRNASYGFAAYGSSTGTAPVLYKLNDGKSDAEIRYERFSDVITEGEPLTPPALNNPHGLTISCSSDNSSVATVNATTGAISVVGGVGTATITVSWDEQTISTVTYRASSTTYTLTINSAAVNYDILNYEYTGINGESYTAWSNKVGSFSGAVYAGTTGGTNSAIQMNAGSPRGIISTTSGGHLKNITVSWNTNTLSDRTLQVYGKNSPYSGSGDLSSADTRGTLIGTIVNGTSTSLDSDNYYEYFGLYATGALYLDEIRITWGDAKTRVASPTSVVATPSGTTITVTWTDSPSNVDHYIVTCTSKEAQVIEQGIQSASFTSLSNGDYDITIQAVPTDITLETGQYAYSTITKIAGVTISGGQSFHYEKVTSTPADWTGSYLLVCEASSKVFTGAISTTSTKYGLYDDVTISENQIAGTSTLEGYECTLAYNSTYTHAGYSIQAKSKYLFWSSGNSLNAGNSVSGQNNIWGLELVDGVLRISNLDTSGASIRYIKFNSDRFACYTHASGYESTAGSAVHLYRRVNN